MALQITKLNSISSEIKKKKRKFWEEEGGRVSARTILILGKDFEHLKKQKESKFFFKSDESKKFLIDE